LMLRVHEDIPLNHTRVFVHQIVSSRGGEDGSG
jgi:hypothetical protein